MYFSRIFRIKEGKVEKFKDWIHQLNTSRREEAIATFAYERITREMFILFRGDDGSHYVIGLNQSSGIPGESDSSKLINQEHTAIKEECLESISKSGEVLLDLELQSI